MRNILLLFSFLLAAGGMPASAQIAENAPVVASDTTAVVACTPQAAADTLAFRACFADVVPLLDIHNVKYFYNQFDALVQRKEMFGYSTLVGYYPVSEFTPEVSSSWFFLNPYSSRSPVRNTGESAMSVDASGEERPALVRNIKGITGFDRSDMYYEQKRYLRPKDSLEVDKARLAAALARFDTLSVSKPWFYATIHGRFGGDYAAYVEALYDTSIFTDRKRLKNFLRHSSQEALQADLGVQHEIGMALYETFVSQVKFAGYTPEQLAEEQERSRREQSMLEAQRISTGHATVRPRTPRQKRHRR